MEHLIYLDNAATTKVYKEVFEAMVPYFEDYYGNPQSIYTFAQKSSVVVEHARETIANFINAKSSEIYFTSGGSESDNWAIKSVAYTLQNKGKHIITSKIEHHAVLHSMKFLEKQGFEVTYLDVLPNGVVDINQLKAAIRPDTILISIMAANNEIGTIEPIKEIGNIAKEHNILFHTDAVQAFGHIPIDVEEMNIDLLSASGHKIGGPKGIGFMYARRTVKLEPLIHGGAQERNKRAGTHNVPGIVGMSKAVEIAAQGMLQNMEKISSLRDYLIEKVLTAIPYVKLNGDEKLRLPNNANFSFRFIEGESMLIMLDQAGVCASSGSACTSGSLDPSHVLLAIGLPHEIAHGSLRLTLSEFNTKEEIDYTVEKLISIIERLRNMSPLYEDFIAGK